MALMGDTERQLRWARYVALMWHWRTLTSGTAGATLIIRAH
ncbi:unnamed protein product [Staurois parvus]|uniref:Uncharacterized protein n=1 Tax=Staurois parvus TaxID=386267 RepID=A0ABN9GX39_9NEOB|nr:unnamed protein product [Staurois parvus]